jgi:acetyl esterase
MLHPDCEAVLRRVAAWDQPDEPSAEATRADELRRQAELGGTGPELFAVRQVTIPVAGRELPAVAYRPGREPTPGVLVWLHGGGWVAGSPDSVQAQARALAQASGCVVLSVDYRLAPEHRFPAAAEDALAAVAWAAAEAESLGAAGGQVAVGGDSAGGNLAAAATLMARDRGEPQIDFQLLVYPVLARDPATASRVRYADGHWLTAAGLEWCWGQYLERDADAASPYASPLLADSLADLPPALIVLAECDVLCDEGRRYGERLQQDGVAATVLVHAGMLHGFMACAGVVGAGWAALREAGQVVGDALRRSTGALPRSAREDD